MIKKSFFVILGSLLLVFAGCSAQKTSAILEKPKVLCTTQLIADSVKKIAGNEVVVEVLIQGEIDPHSYQLVKGDLEKIQEANILFANGLNLEHGSSLKAAIDEHPNAVKIGDYIYKKFPELILKVDGELDPHIWMDVSIWILSIDPIVDALKDAYPAKANLFEQNGSKLKSDWIVLDQTVLKKLQMIPEEKRYLVTSHDAFNYFSRRYLSTSQERENHSWMKRFKAPEGLSPDGQIGPYDIKKILDHLKEHHIAVVFPESNVSLDSLKKIRSVAQSQGVKIVFADDPLFGDSMSGDKLSVDSYEEMMQHNSDVIANYLSIFHPA
jgi:manganese/zinc/iron transport system substrate-binding protein